MWRRARRMWCGRWLAKSCRCDGADAIPMVVRGRTAMVWIGLSDNGTWTDAKSIARVMALKAPQQTMVFFAAEGTDATDAVSALVRLVQSDFTSSKDQ